MVNIVARLEDAGPGDLLVHTSGTVRSLVPVLRTTATQVVVGKPGSERRFSRTTGGLIGAGSWSQAQVSAPVDQATVDAVRAESRRRAVVARLAKTPWADLPDVVLERVVSALHRGVEPQ